MSVGFGFSVGDFLAALKLVGTVIDALRETSNANSSFRSLLNELYALESVLLRVKRLDLEDRDNVGELSLRQAASQCQHTIDVFWKAIQKYQPHLQQNGTNSRIKDGWAKVKWAVCKKNDLETFQAQIRGHTGSIELLLMTVQMEATTMDARKQDSYNKRLTSNMQDLSCQVMGKLSAIASSIGQCVQQGKALLESSAQIVQTNLRVFQMVQDIQLFILRMPGQVQRQQPVYFIDAFNRESPFHLEFVRSAEALLAVLKANIKQSGCDPNMIDRGEFAIEELGTQNLINLTEPWDSCFFPGQRVAMSVIFKGQTTPKSLCPRCGKDCEGSTSQEITCDVCGTIFRRIEEIANEIRDTSQAGDFVDGLPAGDVPESTVNGSLRPPKKRKREEDDALTKVQKFRRIQLLMRDITLVCCSCKKKFKRPCDLTKHERIHSRPWKCSEEECEYFEIGWPTEKERDRHINDEHSNAPVQYKCLYSPCTYASKRESNCKQHMDKAHPWEYANSRLNDWKDRQITIEELRFVQPVHGEIATFPFEGLSSNIYRPTACNLIR